MTRSGCEAKSGGLGGASEGVIDAAASIFGVSVVTKRGAVIGLELRIGIGGDSGE